jgi:hypothetical protein
MTIEPAGTAASGPHDSGLHAAGLHAAGPHVGLQPGGAALARDMELTADGWRRRFVGGPPRLEEMVELYQELGHDVRVEKLVDEDLADSCAGCRVALALFRIVYTRMKP